MHWARLAIPEPSVTAVTAEVMTVYEAAYRAAGRPAKAAIYREYSLGGARVMWFTPEAAELVPVVLKEHGVEHGVEPPNTATLKFIQV